ncbi:hypothetical protein L195_g014258 [Trifolium pratense]|uniref:RNase H type-1 domain-containing protein n=1 Tax=Trifolium pratense TaxID=57577 RepID=A0A2K3PQE6_TRIPR|nr:hypothetical protein L195_g014258 [Trifolium pratense]
MWGMYTGMEFARQKGVTHLIVESDSKLLIDMVTRRWNLNGITLILIWRIQELINMDWLVNHIHIQDSFDFITLETRPTDLQSTFFADISGISMPRTVHVFS